MNAQGVADRTDLIPAPVSTIDDREPAQTLPHAVSLSAAPGDAELRRALERAMEDPERWDGMS